MNIISRLYRLYRLWRQQRKLLKLWNEYLYKFSMQSIYTENEIPIEWSLTNKMFYYFSNYIITKFCDLLVVQKGSRYYSNSTLPYPKDVITKALLFEIDYAKANKEIFGEKKLQLIIANRRHLLIAITYSYVDDTNLILPKSTNKNIEIGSALFNQQIGDEFVERHITWRDYDDWIKEALNSINSNAFYYAEKCLDKAFEFNGMTEELKLYYKKLYNKWKLFPKSYSQKYIEFDRRYNDLIK